MAVSPGSRETGFIFAPLPAEQRTVFEAEEAARPILDRPINTALPLVTAATSTAGVLSQQPLERASDLTAEAQQTVRRLSDTSVSAAADLIGQAMMTAAPLGADSGAIALAMQGRSSQPPFEVPVAPDLRPIAQPGQPGIRPPQQRPPDILPLPGERPQPVPGPIVGPIPAPGMPGIRPPFRPTPVSPAPQPGPFPLPVFPGPVCTQEQADRIARKWAAWAAEAIRSQCDGLTGRALRDCCDRWIGEGLLRLRAELGTLNCTGDTHAAAVDLYVRLTGELCRERGVVPPKPPEPPGPVAPPSKCEPCPTCGEDPCKCVQRIKLESDDEVTVPEAPAPTSDFVVGSSDPLERLDGCAAFEQLIGSIQPIIANALSVWAGLRDASGEPTSYPALDKLKVLGLPVGSLVQDFARAFYDLLDSFARTWLAASGAVTGAGTSRHLIEGGLSILNSLNGGALRHVLERWRQINDYQDPSVIPTAADATAAYLADGIDFEQWRCWTRANGHKQNPAHAIMLAQRSKLSPGEITQLWRRGLITDTDMSARLRQIGFILPEDTRDYQQLSVQLPFISDIIRMMVRDSDDPAIVTRFGTDAQFSDKFGGQLRQWADQQGFSEQAMRYIWRAHWSIPSPTQLYEIFHRQRKHGETIDNSPLGEDVRAALVQQDILPYWIDRLVGISFHPIGRIDARRAYEVGAIDDEGVRAAYRALGYDDVNTETLLRFVGRLRQTRWDNDRAAREYGQGLANRAESLADMTDRGAPQDVAVKALDRNFRRLQSASREACKRSLRRRFLAYELEAGDVQQELVALGLDAEQALAIFRGWSCERELKGKHFTAQQLCQLADDGLITGDDFFSRLKLAGWEAVDARAIVAQCSLKISRRQAREAETAAKQVQREGDRLARLAKGRLSAELKRKKALAKAAVRYASVAGLPVDDAVQVVDAERARLRREFAALTLDEVVEVLVKAAEGYVHPGPPSYSDLVDDFAAGFLDLGEPALLE